MTILDIECTIPRNGESVWVKIDFKVTSFLRGAPARINWDENDCAADPDEYEFQILKVACIDSEDGELTESENAAARACFDSAYDESCEIAERVAYLERRLDRLG